MRISLRVIGGQKGKGIVATACSPFGEGRVKGDGATSESAARARKGRGKRGIDHSVTSLGQDVVKQVLHVSVKGEVLVGGLSLVLLDQVRHRFGITWSMQDRSEERMKQ